MTCRACKLDHPLMENCGVARRRMENSVNTITEVVNTNKVVPDEPVNTKLEPVNTRKADRHKPGYMREYMKSYRATVH